MFKLFGYLERVHSKDVPSNHTMYSTGLDEEQPLVWLTSVHFQLHHEFSAPYYYKISTLHYPLCEKQFCYIEVLNHTEMESSMFLL